MINSMRTSFLSILILFAVTLPASGNNRADSQTNHKLLVQVVAVGGMTPRGGGRSESRVYDDGILEFYSIRDDQTQARGSAQVIPGGFDGWYKAQLTNSELNELRSSVANVHLSALKLNAQTHRPSALDGVDVTATFNTRAGKISVPLWQLPRDQPLQPVTMLSQLVQKHFQR